MNLYDVLLVSKVVYNDAGSNEPDGKKYETDIRRVEDKIKGLYQSFSVNFNTKCKEGFSVEEGAIYSSNFVELDPKNADYTMAMKSVRSVKAVEMEAYGSFLAEGFYKESADDEKHIIILRGISDKSDIGKTSTYDDGNEPEVRKVMATSNALIALERYCEFNDALNS